MLTFIDWFAGIGGFRRGMELAGHKCVGFCEYDKYAVASYTSMHLITERERERLASLDLKKRQKEILKEEYRHGEWYESDVVRVHAGDIPRADCWCFGFPCQDISVAGHQKGFKGNRSSLFFRITGLLKELKEEDRPKYLFIENVRNLLSIGKGYDFARLLVELDSIGYDAEWEVLNSKDFRVPQNRERCFIIGHLRGAGGREVFPLRRDAEETSVQGAEVKQIAQMNRPGRDNLNQYRVYDKDGIAPCLNTMGGGGLEPHIVDKAKVNRIAGIENSSQRYQVYDKEGLSPTLDTSQGGGREPHIQIIGNTNPSRNGMNGQVYDSKGLAPTLSTNKGEGTKVAIPCLTPDRENKRQNGRRFKEDGDPIFTLTAQDRHGVMIEAKEPQVLRNVRSEYGKEIRKEYEKGNVDISRHEFLELEPRTDGVTNTLSTVTKDNLVLTKEVDGFNTMPDGSARTLKHQYQKNSAANFEKQNAMGATAVIEKSVDPTAVTMVSHEGEEGIPIKVANKKGYCMAEEGDSINFQQANSETRRGRVGKGVAQTLDTGCQQGVLTSYRIRKLTPRECFRLQGWTDDYFEKAESVNSNAQLYKQAGNGVTVNVIYQIARRLE